MTNKNRAIIFCVFILGTLLVFTITGAIFRLTGAERSDTNRLAIQFITCVLCLVGYLLLRARLGSDVSRTALPRLRLAMFGWILAGLIFSLIPYALVLDFNALHWQNLHSKLLFAASVMAINAAILEEIFFRDMLLRWMRDRYRVGVCLIAQIILFSGMHFLSSPFEWSVACAFAISAVLLSMLWLLTGDFIAPMAAHFILNFTTILFNGIFTRFVSSPGLLIGEPSPYQFYARTSFEVLAVLILWAVWLRHIRDPNSRPKLNLLSS
jgi:membrane protease YdiL (CAAX protease family)